MTPTRRATQGNGRKPIESNHNDRIERVNLVVPDYRWVWTAARTFDARPYYFNSGNSVTRLPFRPDVGDDPLPVVMELTDNLSFNLDTTGLGGIADGLGLVASADYLCWAFAESTLDTTLYGVAMTRQPIASGASTASGGGFGVSATFTVSAGIGLLFTIGSRIRVRNGVVTASSWNYGTVTATTSTTIVATMDASNGTAINPNTTLAGGTGLTIHQLNDFVPRASGSADSLFSQRPFSYLGSVSTNASSNIKYFRKRGDPLLFPRADIRPRTGITASEASQVGLGIWLPDHAYNVHGNVYVGVTSGAATRGVVTIGADSAIIENDQQTSATAGQVFQSSTSEVVVQRSDTSVNLAYIEVGNVTSTYGSFIQKYNETEW